MKKQLPSAVLALSLIVSIFQSTAQDTLKYSYSAWDT